MDKLTFLSCNQPSIVQIIKIDLNIFFVWCTNKEACQSTLYGVYFIMAITVVVYSIVTVNLNPIYLSNSCSI